MARSFTSVPSEFGSSERRRRGSANAPALASTRRLIHTYGPGFTLLVAAVAVVRVLASILGGVSSLTIACLAGVVIANCGVRLDRAEPGLRFAARRFTRVGVVLLGVGLSLGDVVALGVPTLVLVVAVVGATFLGTIAVGRRVGLSPQLSLLMASGFSICGPSAIAAVGASVGDVDENESAYAVALTTLCGTACIAILPALAVRCGLDAHTFGIWAGASVHDVGQVVATASSGGAEALDAAVLVKLGRIVLLAPIIVGVGIAVGTRRIGRPGARGGHGGSTTQQPPIVPLFVVSFLAAAVLRSIGVVPEAVVDGAATAQRWLFLAALIAIGTGVKVPKLRGVGVRPLFVGVGATVFIATVSLAGALLVSPTM